MTLSTGRRSFRACLRCRQRKTKCDLDATGEPKKPPCNYCYHAGKECILVESRRGRSSQSQRLAQQIKRSSERSNVDPNISKNSTASTVSEQEAIRFSEVETGNYTGRKTDAALRMELKNPSDALKILMRSGELIPNQQASTCNSQSGSQSQVDTATYSPQLLTSTGNAGGASTISNSRAQMMQSTTAFDAYDLVQSGVLHPSIVPELLLVYARNYHPYCPIVPAYFLERSAMEHIQRSDYFLLTILLTVGSRDLPNHTLTHRYCWDHTQRLLLDVVLARPWTQTPRTVEGLLLLSEWLPHIQSSHMTVESPRNLMSEDKLAWSLIGIAVRQAYLLRLDRAAFRDSGDKEPTERAEQHRIIWNFLFIADRQISARLGQSFWSRGPSLSSQYTAKDFPSLSSTSNVNNSDYASVLQANIELTQILHNSHSILYSSKKRTLEMIHDGDYARYLDDFLRATTSWYDVWADMKVPQKIRSTMLLTYEYVCLYVNTFSLQAVLTRWSTERPPLQRRESIDEQTLAGLFSRGIMLSPDGRYILGAIRAAMNLLRLMNDLDPRQILCYLPLRFHLYGIYATVFLYRALSAGAFESDDKQEEITITVLRFISIIEEASSTESHICRLYSKMLRELWTRFNVQRSQLQVSRTMSGTSSDHGSRSGSVNFESHTSATGASILPTMSCSAVTMTQEEDDRHCPTSYSNGVDDTVSGQYLLDIPGQSHNVSASPSIETYLLGSFWPGVIGFGSQEGYESYASDQHGLWTNGADIGLGSFGQSFE